MGRVSELGLSERKRFWVLKGEVVPRSQDQRVHFLSLGVRE